MTTPTGIASVSPDLQKRLKELESVETTVRDLIQLTQSTICELSKEKQASKNKMDECSNSFKAKVNSINNTLSAQMAYLQNVCVGSAHQGSTFASQRNIEFAESAEMALHSDVTKLTEMHFPPSLDDNNPDQMEQ